MKLNEEIKRQGYFWLPSNPEKRVPGTLSITDGGDINLEIIGSFDESIEAKKKVLEGVGEFEVILGDVEKYGPITLKDCFYRSWVNIFQEISKVNIAANFAFLGDFFETAESIKLNRFRFTADGLSQWIRETGMGFSEDGKTINISYTEKENVKIKINDNLQLYIIFSPKISVDHIKGGSLSQEIYLELKSEKEEPLDFFTENSFKIINFISFAINQTLLIENASTTKNSAGEIKKIINIFYSSSTKREGKLKVLDHEMIFDYRKIKSNIEEKIKLWMTAYQEIDAAMHLYFSVVTDSHRHLESKFIALAQGLETYHRRKNNKKLMKEEDFESMKTKILESCPSEHRNWLEGRMRYGNEINLANRIKDLIAPFEKILGNKKQRESFVRSIVDTRNYLTHYDLTLKKKAKSGLALHSLNKKIEALFQLQILIILGFTSEEIDSVLKDSYYLRQNLQLN